ncbi:Putative FK506-binding protein 5 [Rhizopus microsporus]|nr:Putative FK506-binding protein 5 [Rhizopus microsporus]
MQVEQLTKDGAVTKKIIKEGLGKTPESKNIVSVHYDAYLLDTNTKFDSSRDRETEFTFQLRDSKVIEAWELAIPTMKVGEIAEVTCTSDYGYGDEGRKYLVPPKAKLRFEIELLGFWEKPTTAPERIAAAHKKKNEGNEMFQQGTIETALFAYRKAREYVKDLWDCEPEELDEARQLTVAIHLNIGACYLKLKQYDDAIDACKKALSRDHTSIKAYYRLGQAYMEKGEYEASLTFINLGLELKPNDKSLQALKKSVEQTQQKYLKSSTSLYRKMFNTPQPEE